MSQDRRVDDTISAEINPSSPSAPGRSTMTSRLAPRALIFRVESPEAARELGSAFGRRDGNGVASGADAFVQRAASSSGSPLPSGVKDQFESSLGADLSAVRVHTGGASAEAASAVGARAYTTGNDIHFAAGQYRPSDPFGVHLLAHEVAHTVQQAGGAQTTQYKLEVSTPGDAAEVEADRAADAMVSGRPAQVSGLASVIHRKTDAEKTDENMTSFGDMYADSSGKDEEVKIMGSRSVVSDKAAASKLISTIDANAPGVREAYAQNKSKYDNYVGGSPVEVNTATRFALQKYMTSLLDSDRTLTQFQGAFQTAVADRARLRGMADAYLTSKKIATNGSSMDAVTQGYQKFDKLKQHVTNAKKDGAMRDAIKDYNEKRDRLETTKFKIEHAQGDCKAKSQGLLSGLYTAQANAASAKAKDKTTELNTLRADIDQAVKWTMGVVSFAGTITSALFIPKLLTAKEADDAAGTAVTNASSDDDGSQKFAKLKEAAGKGADAAGKLGLSPEVLMKKALEMAEAKKIGKLEADIEAAQEEANLATAASAAKGLEKLQTEMMTALRDMAVLVETFVKDRNNLKLSGDAFATQAIASGDPELAIAARFLTGSDEFMAQVDVAIKMGQEEQDAGKDSLDQRKALGQAGWTMPDDDPSMKYFTAKSYVKDGVWKKEKIWYVEKNEVQLATWGVGSLAGKPANADGSENPDFGAQNVTALALQDLDKWKKEIGSLRSAIQNAMGIGDPTANTAL